MRSLSTTLCGKRCLGLRHVGPVIHDTFSSLAGVEVPTDQLPHKDSVMRFTIEFFLCWKFDVARKLSQSEVHFNQL